MNKKVARPFKGLATHCFCFYSGSERQAKGTKPLLGLVCLLDLSYYAS
jgi:hypothetical protein